MALVAGFAPCAVCEKGDGAEEQEEGAVGQQADGEGDEQEEDASGEHKTDDAGAQRLGDVGDEDGKDEEEDEDVHGGGLRGLCAGAWSGGRVLFPRGERLAQFGKEGAFPLVRLKNAQVRHPVAHDGQQLLRVVDAGGNQQAAVGVLLRALPGQ